MSSATLSFCARQVRRFDKDRFLCMLFAPPPQREALYALHAFALELARIRESVREPLLGHMRLRWWADTVAAIYAGQVVHGPVDTALADAVGRYGIARVHLDQLISGRSQDLDDAMPASLAALIEYAAATSGALSLAGLQVLRVNDEAARDAARNIGIAWALIGLVRAVPFHARFRRFYLPADLSRDAGFDSGRLFDRGHTDGLPLVARHIVEQARTLLRDARAQRARVPSPALPVLLPAVLADAYATRLSAAGYDPFHAHVQRPLPSRLIRLAIARARKRY